MRVRIFAVLLGAFVSAGMISCGGGGGGSGSFGFLAGTWFGTWESQFGAYIETVEMTIDSKGRISNVLGDGIPYDDGSGGDLAGQITKESDQSYNIDWNDGSTGGFILEAGNEHFAYLDDVFFVGILQKGTTAHPIYSEPDYQYTWSGYSVWVDTGMNVTNEGPTTLTVDNSSEVLGTTLNGAFAGTILSWSDQSRGVAYGEATSPADYFFEVFMSADKQFVATYACPDTFFDFYDCEFGGWERQ